MDITKKLLEELLKSIKFDKDYVEATFQFRLLMKLAKEFGGGDKIFPERSIGKYIQTQNLFTKKEIDIAIESAERNSARGMGECAIELKMPMNGRVPETMYDFIKDIQFLEDLVTKGVFLHGFLVVVTNDDSFWKRTNWEDDTSIYQHFREPSTVLSGKIYKPTGSGKNKDSHELSGSYKIEWTPIDGNPLDGGFRFFIVPIANTERP